ncbi:hypothetical protein ACTMU2_26195 [Cupriavidus basilensis]
MRCACGWLPQGLPKSGTTGLELMDNQKFGISQFAEQVNYQRRSSKASWRARSKMRSPPCSPRARRLAIPKPTLFVRRAPEADSGVDRACSSTQVAPLMKARSPAIGHAGVVRAMPRNSRRRRFPSSASTATCCRTHGAGTERMLDATQLKYVQALEQDFTPQAHRIDH